VPILSAAKDLAPFDWDSSRRELSLNYLRRSSWAALKYYLTPSLP